MLYSLLSASAILLGAVQAQTGTPAGTTAAPGAGTAALPIAATTTSAPVTPVQPVVVQPVPPVTQTPPVQPPPVTQTPPVQQPPVTPQTPPATPQYGYPQQPGFNPYGQFGGFMGGMVDPQNLKCEFGQCVNRRISLTPGQGFKLECQRPGMCNGLDLTLNVGIDPQNFGNMVNEINDLTFDAPQRDVKVRIQGGYGNNIEVNNIHCKVFGACTNLQVTTGFNVEAWNIEVHCEQPGACNGCTVNGMSCTALAIMNGNNNGFGYFGGFGYQNQPNLPVAPQGPPQYPGPQQPPQPALPQYPPQGYPNPMWI